MRASSVVCFCFQFARLASVKKLTYVGSVLNPATSYIFQASRMTDKDDLLPPSPVEGLVPTMNKTGWMTVALDDYSREFAAFAGEIGQDGEESLDIGCAYGVATLAALAKGARIYACDIEPEHLRILEKRVPTDAAERFRCKPGAMPEVDFEANGFGAILAARVLHFLDGEQIGATLRKMYAWLRPGGRLYVVVDTPYTGPWAIHAEAYEQKKAAGDPWPGFFADYVSLLPDGVDPTGHPEFINPLDPDILERECRQAGFDVIATAFLPTGLKNATGREHAGIVASKPTG